MRVVHLDCKNCGAPLETRKGSKKQLVCEFCGSKSFVKETEGKEARGKIRNPELERLDAQWRRERRRYETRNKHGQIVRPSGADAVGVVIIGVMIGVFLMMVATNEGAGSGAAVVMLVLAVAAVYAQYAGDAVVAGAFRGMGAVAAGLILGTALKLASALGSNPMGLRVCALAGIAVFIAVALLPDRYSSALY